MENNPKKSKAFIITFILILLLLLVAYYLFTNRNKIFDVGGSTSISKIFAPLLGTSKTPGLVVIDDKTPTTDKTTGTRITGTVITTQNGNKVVRAQAGENLKKGDVLYIAGFNTNSDPIIMKAIASDKNKSLVFGVAGEDMNKGAMGNVIIEGILEGVNTNRNEGTLWSINNPLYLSDKIYGGMTKNPPVAITSFIVPVGSVIKVDPTNGSIRIGNIVNNPNINNNYKTSLKALNSGLLNGGTGNVRDFWNSIFGGGNGGGVVGGGGVAGGGAGGISINNNGFILSPISIPGASGGSVEYLSVNVLANSSPIAYVKSGDIVTISWKAVNATSCKTKDNNSTKTDDFFFTPKITTDKSYTITCSDNKGSTTTGTAYVMISNQGEKNIPQVTVNSDLSYIKPGETSTISWKAVNATSCESKDTKSTKTEDSFKTPILTEKGSYVYTITCKNAKDGESSGVAYVTVGDISGNAECSDKRDNNANGLIDDKDPNCHVEGVLTGAYIPSYYSESFPSGMGEYKYPIVKLSADKNFVEKDESTTIRWSSENATSCNAGTGNSTETQGSFSTGKLSTGKSFTVTCTGKMGTNSNNIYIGIVNNIASLTSVKAWADPATIIQGKTTTINWKATNATLCKTPDDKNTKTEGFFKTPILSEVKDYSFAILCTGAIGMVGDNAIVKVTQDNGVTTDNTIGKTQCSDGIDNNGNNLIDIKDPNCHEGGDINKPYVASHDSENKPAPVEAETPIVNSCISIEKNPLVFTDDENARLAVLLRKFYLISSTLRTSDDLTAVNSEIEQNKNFINQIEGLTKQCYEQVPDSMMTTNNWSRHGNPWYTKTTGGSFPYTNENKGYLKYDQIEGGLTPNGLKVVSGYYYGKTSTGEDCNKYNNFKGYGLIDQINNKKEIYLGHYMGGDGLEAVGSGFPGDTLSGDTRQPEKIILEEGCSWKDGVILDNTERLLNIW